MYNVAAQDAVVHPGDDRGGSEMSSQRRDPIEVSRRSLLLAGAAPLALGNALAQNSGKTLTAGEIIGRIKANVGIPWREKTVDNIIAGSAETPVKGIATVMMATLEMVRRAAAAGKNMVVTHESTFFSHQDITAPYVNDATYLYKLDFLKKNDMVVLHFHDHWHGHRPDGINAGMAMQLGWEKNADAQNPRIYSFPATPLSKFAADMQKRLGAHTMRVVGDPNLPVRKVMTFWGSFGANGSEGAFTSMTFARPEIDVLICGEAREWELVEYAQDSIGAGQKKALVVLGHVVSEQFGMKYCAEWLRSFVPEIPVEFLQMEDPFWNPGNPG
jgi:putative NIF3 family GTP cyclohydrolase 1 type 2